MASSSLFARAGRRLYTSSSVIANPGRRLYTSGSVSRTRQHHAAGSHLHRIEGYSLMDKNTKREAVGLDSSTGVWVDVMEDGATPEERKETLRRLLRDDSLIVRCDVIVQSVEEESRAKWFLRRFLQ